MSTRWPRVVVSGREGWASGTLTSCVACVALCLKIRYCHYVLPRDIRSCRPVKTVDRATPQARVQMPLHSVSGSAVPDSVPCAVVAQVV